MRRLLISTLLGISAGIGISARGGEPVPTTFHDDFERADGPAGNGWTGWWRGDWPNDAQISLVNGELVTHGSSAQAGGVFRELPVRLPFAFSFDFRTPLTPSENQCSGGQRNEGAWFVGFNIPTPQPGDFYPQLSGRSQVAFAYNNPQAYVARLRNSATGSRVEDYGVPVAPRPVPGQVREWPAMHIDGVVREDGSATITISFNDNGSPDPVTYEFAPVPGGLQPPQGSHFAIGNGSCNTGQHIFDNVEVSDLSEVVDTTPPVVVCESPDADWHADDVALTCTANDEGSGLAHPTDAVFMLATSVPVGTETHSAVTGSRTVCDAAANCTIAPPVGGIRVDKRAPAIVIGSPTAMTYVLGQAVPAAFDCHDAGSGLDTCAGSTVNGGLIPTQSVGHQLFSVRAADVLGHTSGGSIEYSVRYAICVPHDRGESGRGGGVLPVRVQMCDAAGANLSSRTLTVTAVSVRSLTTGAAWPLEDAGHANPGNLFRFTDDGYLFNLSLKDFAAGTYELVFQAGPDPHQHAVQVLVRSARDR